MKRINWQILLGLALVALSALFYSIHFLLFRDAHHIFIYLVGDVAFVPIEVLLVTLIIDRVLAGREKRSMLKKLNMVIGTFFSEVGTGLLKHFSDMDPQVAELSTSLQVNTDWTKKDFKALSGQLRHYQGSLEATEQKLEDLQQFTGQKRDFLLRLLENPNLLEHETFTELLWAVFHLGEELAHRDTLQGLPPADADHLAGDIKRAYGILISEWLQYLEHLRSDYPYLFSLALRTNPFDKQASVQFT